MWEFITDCMHCDRPKITVTVQIGFSWIGRAFAPFIRSLYESYVSAIFAQTSQKVGFSAVKKIK